MDICCDTSDHIACVRMIIISGLLLGVRASALYRSLRNSENEMTMFHRV